MVQTIEQIATALVDINARFDTFKYFFWGGITLSVSTSLTTIGFVITHVIRAGKYVAAVDFDEFKSNHNKTIDGFKEEIQKLDRDAFAKLDKIKTELKSELEKATTKLFEMQEHDNEVLVGEIKNLNRGREENKMCLRDIKGRINLIEAICKERHDEEDGR